MNCIIIGDKYQKGMKSKGCSALMRMNKQSTIIDNQYDTLTNLFDDLNITYIYGFDAKRLLDFVEQKKYNIDMVYNQDYEKYNDGYSLGLVSDKLDGDTLVLLGYQTLTSKISKKIDGLKHNSGVFVTNNMSDPKIGCVIHDNSITTFNFGLSNYIYDIYYINKECSSYLKSILSTNKHHNYFLFELLNKILDSGLTIKPIVI